MQRPSVKYSFLKNYLSFSMGTWVHAVVSFFTVPITSWLISPSDYGKANMFLVLHSMALLMVLFGTPNALMRFYHNVDYRERLLWSSLIIPVSLSTIFGLFSVIFRERIGILLIEQKSSNVHLILTASVFLGIFQTFNQTVIRMQGRGLVYSALQVVNSTSNVGFLIAYAIFVQRNFYALLYAQLFSSLTTLSLGIYLQREHWLPIKIDKNLVREILTYSYPFLFSGLLWWLLGWTDRIVLRMYTSFAEIGLYSAAFKLIAVMNLFTTGFSTFWYPFAYEQYEKNPENREIFSKVFEYVSFLMLALGLIILSGKNLIFMLFAKSYRSSAYIAPFLLLYPVSIMMAIVVARGIDFAKKTYWFMVSDGVAALFNLFGNLLLIPSLGAKGAALSTGLSFVIVFAIESSVSVRLYPFKYKFKRAYMSIGIFAIVAALNSFIERPSVGVLSGLMGLTLVILLYQDVFKRLVRDVFEVWDLVAKKYR